jgi:uncharacterized membrane-anchored protein YjiN (DUF445 family)
MRRTDYPSIASIAQEVLLDVDVEKRIKTAEQSILQRVLQPSTPQGTTELTRDLLKLAQQVRNEPADEVTYDDITNFLGHVNATR